MSCSKYGEKLIDCTRSDEYRLLPRIDISALPTNIPHLTKSDVDLHMPHDINFNYYTTHEFHNDQEINHCFSGRDSFSVLNCNIRSLAKNFDGLVNMLSEMYFHFSIIGLIEIKFKVNQDSIINCNLGSVHNLCVGGL